MRDWAHIFFQLIWWPMISCFNLNFCNVHLNRDAFSTANDKNPSLLPPLPFMRHFEWKLGTIFAHDWIISHFLLCDSMGIIFAPGQNWATVPHLGYVFVAQRPAKNQTFWSIVVCEWTMAWFSIAFFVESSFCIIDFFPSSTCCCVKSLNWTNRYYHQMGNLFCALKWSFKKWKYPEKQFYSYSTCV